MIHLWASLKLPKRVLTMEVSDRFWKVSLRITPLLPGKEIAVAWLDECGFDMFEDSPTGVVAFARESELDKDSYDNVMEDLKAIAEVEVEEEWVESENWNAQWERSYEPIEIEGKVTIRAPFHQPPSEGLDVVIQPEMSFGTGHHPTTWLMMRALWDLELVGMNVLDMGCGTGALAIGAKKLGASFVKAVDIDEWSYRNAMDNVLRNKLSLGKDFEVVHGDASAIADDRERFDVVLANINRNILLKDLALYAMALKPSGVLLISGFFPSDAEPLISASSKTNMQLSNKFEREGWACIMFKKSAVLK